MAAGEIKYNYQKLMDSAKTIMQEKEQVRGVDAQFLDGLQSDINSFRSDYADKAGETIRNMKDVGARNLGTLLEEYAIALGTAGEVMKELEGKTAEAYSQGGAS